MDPSLTDTKQKIIDALDHLKRELAAIRAGRANPSLLEELPVLAYGTRMKLMEVGTITAPGPTLLMVQVWDSGVLRDVEKAIRDSNLGLSPSVDGTSVRIAIPPLTQERRTEFVKVAKTKGEEIKVEIRQIRQEQRGDFEEDKKNGDIGEDEFFRLEKELQNLIEKAIAEVDELVKVKEADLMEI